MILVPSLLVMLAATVEAKRAGAAPIIDVDPDVWVQECATLFQETCCASGTSTDFRSEYYSYYVNYSSYDVLKKPSGLCTVRTSTYGHVSLRTNSMISLIRLSSFLVPRSIVFVLCIIPITNTQYIYLYSCDVRIILSTNRFQH